MLLTLYLAENSTKTNKILSEVEKPENPKEENDLFGQPEYQQIFNEMQQRHDELQQQAKI